MREERTDLAPFGNAYEYVGFWTRVGASLIDGVILLALTAPVLTLVYGPEYWQYEGFIAGFWDFMINWVLPAILVVWLWSWKQATPGKMVLKASIVDAETGGSPTMKQWIIRYLGYILSTLPLFLGYFWIGWDSKKQGWHDKLAGTVVIRPQNKGVEAVQFSADKK